MFRSVSLRNFKSLANVRVNLGPFTVLVGANGSGKSSFLQAIELFSWAVRHESINDSLLNHNVDFRDLVYLRSSKARITFDADLEFPKEGIELACERVHVWMRLAKKRYVYLTEHVRPGDAPPKNVTDWAYGVVSRKRYQRAWEANGPAIEHRNVALGHSMLGDIYSAEGSRQKFPILRKVADHFMNYVHYEIWGPEKLRDPSLHPVSSRRNGAGCPFGQERRRLAAIVVVNPFGPESLGYSFGRVADRLSGDSGDSVSKGTGRGIRTVVWGEA